MTRSFNFSTRRPIAAPLYLISLLVSLLALGGSLFADTTVTFQNGANGYSGAQDISISTQYGQYNAGNGTTSRGDSELGCYSTTGDGAYESRYLLKFGALTISTGSTVVSATLTMSVDAWYAGGNLTGFYLKNGWNSTSNKTGWVHKDDTSDWAAGGAGAAGTDTVAGKSFRLPALRAIGNQKLTIALDRDQVQAWVNSPAANQGILLVNNNPGDTALMESTAAQKSLRPMLTIVVGGAVPVQVGVSPGSVTLQPGQTQQFTSVVTGTSNTVVTWTATGGTISAAGLYTAGATTGASFTVTATSAADTTKSGSAAVTIQPAPVVSVALSPGSATLQPGKTQQFTATVTGTSNTAVTWNATGGTITASGLFTAGSTAGSFSVIATSVVDTTKSRAATITIQAAPPVSVTVSPTSATLEQGKTQQFTATVTGTSNTGVTWSATGGTISAAGLFTAGSTAGSFTVTATSVTDSTKSGNAGVTVQAAPVSVKVSPTSATMQTGQSQQFTATVTGSTNTGVTWTTTGGTISPAGLFTTGQSAGNFTVTATAAADTSKKGTASVRVNAASNLPPVTRQSDGAFVAIQSPVSGMHFTAPATIRIYADPFDIDAPDQDALTVTFVMNGQSVGTYTGSAAQNGYFPLMVNNLAAGTYTLTARINTLHNGVVMSAPVTVFVDNPRVSAGQVFNLTADVQLSGAQTVNYTGTVADRCTINGNGFRIRTASNFTGSLNIANCDIRGLGTAANPAIDVTVNGSGSVQLAGNVFDTSGTVSIATNDQTFAVVRGNEFRENTLVPAGSEPNDVSSLTLPIFNATGNSSAQKFFQGNNVGLSTVVFDHTRNWLIGGNADAESNILMGVRCGFTISASSNMVLRGNYSQHNYPHRFSEGENFELQGDGFLVEHNVIRGSSWPVRGMGGELRYNLIDEGGNSHAAMEAPLGNANIHHNVFVFSINQTLYGPESMMSLLYNVDGVVFRNNVMDGGGTSMGFYGSPISVSSGAFLASLRNNVFYNFAGLAGQPALVGSFGESTNPPLARLHYSDYNDFFNPDASNQLNYGLGVAGLAPGSAGYGLHDLGGFNGHMNPKFAQPTAIPFPFAPEDIWNRVKKVSDVLGNYRAMYSPAVGSPLVGAGDPQDGAGNIGAVGNGEAADRFGFFGNGPATPVPPSINSFTASSNSVEAGQTVTLNWSVTGADMLSLAPGGSVSGTSASVTPAATTTYTLTAANAGGSVNASATVTVIGGATVAITLSPRSASLAGGASKQFTATVTGTSNTAVTWTATGGSVSSAGLYTAGANAGSFSVTATSAADPSKSASSPITVTITQTALQVSPNSVGLLANGTQQFTANSAVTWTATGGTITPTGLYTAGAAAGSFTVTAMTVQSPAQTASAGITVFDATNTAHPRIILDAPTLSTLRGRAQARTQEWTRLKAVCDSFTGGGKVNFIGDDGYPDAPSVGEGYQGSGYFDALLPLGLCYQTTVVSDPATAAKYATKAVAILMAMTDPAHQSVDSTPVWDRDNGYGIRNFGVAMGIAYDWFHDALTAAQRTQIQTALNNWITGFENDSADDFEYEHPQGNYFAGYYAAKCMAALAVQGDNALGDIWWNDWYNHQHLQREQPYYAANLAGGGWLEGFAQYGILSSRNQALPALAVKTAKGIDLIHPAGPNAQPYTFPLDQARYLMSFTWPTRDIIDDRGELYSTGDPNFWPGTATVDIYRFFAGFLTMWGDPAAPMMHKYAEDAKAALDALDAGQTTEWIDFLFWSATAPDAPDYSSLPLSYLAPGIGEVGARSDWSTSATFLSFLSGPYINNPAAGHEAFDKGSPAIERNKNPLLVNAPAWLSHEPNGDPGWSYTYDDRFGNWDVDHNLGNRTLTNTFQVRHLDASGGVMDNYGQWALQRTDGVRTNIGRYEDGDSYVLATGQFLEDMYRPFQSICAGRSPVTSWSRQIVYLRPSQVVIYDRTGICNASLDQYLAFHFPGNPVEATAPATGARRFDVSNGGKFAGSMTTILPANVVVNTTDHLNDDSDLWNKVWRSELRAPGSAATGHVWMNVFDLAPSPGQVAAASAVNVTSGAAVGAVLQSPAGNSVVVSGTAAVGTPITGPLTYVVPAAQTLHIVTDLASSTGYTVVVSVTAGNHTVSITQGGSRIASSNGVVTFQVNAAGQIVP